MSKKQSAPPSARKDSQNSLANILSDRRLRRAYLEHDFLTFWTYYFSENFIGEIKPYQREYAHALGHSKKNILAVMFRASLKTSIALAHMAWVSCYSKEPYCIVQAYESRNSTNLTTQLARILMSERIVRDYGEVYQTERSRDDLSKQSVANFTTTTGVRWEAKSLGEQLRGTFTGARNNATVIDRPTLLYADDIDVTASTKNRDIIDANENKLMGETVGAMDPVRQRIIILGNVIHEDGVIPRLYRKYNTAPQWRCFWQPLFDAENRCVWPEKFTEEVISSLQAHGSTEFAQNYLLTPLAPGDKIIAPEFIDVVDGVVGVPEQVYFGVDPAFSQKTGSDALGWACCVIGRVGETLHRTIVEAKGFEGRDKDEERMIRTLLSLRDIYKPSVVYVEGNNGGEIFGKIMRRAGLPVVILSATKDKETRLREWQGEFERGTIHFLRGKTESLQEQLRLFPSKGVHDDMCFVEGTPIMTICGTKNIQDLNIGDLVFTPFWFRKILNVRKKLCSNIIENSNVWLIWTHDHRVPTSQHIFCKLKDVWYNTIVSKLNFNDLLKWRLLKKYFLTEKYTAWCEKDDIIFLTPHAIQKEKALRLCIEMFGSFIRGKKYLKAFQFIISTIILSITVLKILRLLKKESTFQIIWKSVSRTLNMLKSKGNIWKKSGEKQRNGTRVNYEESGTVITGKTQYEKVDTNILVKYAGNSGNLTGKSHFPAQETAWIKILEGSEEVYNITVEDAHCYYANGILVWNCDAMVYAFWPPKHNGGFVFG